MGEQWNPVLYDGKLGFVAEYGKDLLSLLNPQEGERILDIGCGTGDLTNEIRKHGASILGIDLSLNMINKAKEKYPDIPFIQANAEQYKTEEPLDAVFSNAALHWMKNPDLVVDRVWHSLRNGGRFIAEFGGKGNVEKVIASIEKVMESYGISVKDRNPWYFPSIGEYTSLLERHGFRTGYALHFDRPSILQDGYDGLDHWLNMFADSFFQDISTEQRKVVFEKIKLDLLPTLYQDDHWVVDYKRLRIIAYKE